MRTEPAKRARRTLQVLFVIVLVVGMCGVGLLVGRGFSLKQKLRRQFQTTTTTTTTTTTEGNSLHDTPGHDAAASNQRVHPVTNASSSDAVASTLLKTPGLNNSFEAALHLSELPVSNKTIEVSSPPPAPPVSNEIITWTWSAKDSCQGSSSVAAELNCLTKASVEREVPARSRKVAFLKTHKTGSTTFSAILHRWGVRHCLQVYDAPWRAEHYYTGSKHNKEVDIFNRHVKVGFFKLVPSLKTLLHANKQGDPFFLVTLIREPVDQYVSAFNYYTWPKQNKLDLETYVRGPGALKNLLCDWDLRVTNQQELRRFMDEGLPMIDMVVLTHKWAEGMTMLGERLGWHAIDATYLEAKKNREGAMNFQGAALGKWKTRDLSQETTEHIKKLVSMDLEIYAAAEVKYAKQLEEVKGRLGVEEFARRVAETERVQGLLLKQCEAHPDTQACFWYKQGDLNLENDADKGYSFSKRRDSQYHLGGNREPEQTVSDGEMPTGCEAARRRATHSPVVPPPLPAKAVALVSGAMQSASMKLNQSAGACGSPALYAVGTDIRGGDMHGGLRWSMTKEECCTTCVGEPQCRHFTFWDGRCFLKATMPGTDTSPGARAKVSGTVRSVSGGRDTLPPPQIASAEGAPAPALKRAAAKARGVDLSLLPDDGPRLSPGVKYKFMALLLTRIGFVEDRMQLEFRELREWLEYAFYAGIDHVIVYDNWRRPNETLGGCLQPYVDKGLVTRIDWNLNNAKYPTCQKLSFVHFEKHYMRHAEFAITLDVDEYPMVWADQSEGFLLRYVQSRPECALYFPCQFWVGPRPETKLPGQLFMERYVFRTEAAPYPQRTKTAYRTAAVESATTHAVHLRAQERQEAADCNGLYKVPPEQAPMVHFWGHRHYDPMKSTGTKDESMKGFAQILKAAKRNVTASELQSSCPVSL